MQNKLSNTIIKQSINLEQWSKYKKTRRQKQIINPVQIHEMKKILGNKGLASCGLTWLQLGFKTQVDAFKTIIKCVIDSLNYHKCFACQRNWQSLSSKKNKIGYVKYMLEKYFESEDWDRIRFSDKIHFGWDS